MRWKHRFRETHPASWKQQGPCGTCGLSPGPRGGRDMHTHSLAVAADSKLRSPTATGFSIVPVRGIPCQLLELLSLPALVRQISLCFKSSGVCA